MYSFKNNINQEMKNLIQECIKMCDDANIPISKNITFGLDSAERRHGVCKYNLRTEEYQITISKYLVKTEDKKNTIIHELLHSCADGHSHGYGWQRHAHTIYKNYGIVITRCSSKEHTQVDIAHSRRQYFSKEEYEADGGKYLVAIGRVDSNTPSWYVKKTSRFAKNIDKYTSHGKKLRFM